MAKLDCEGNYWAEEKCEDGAWARLTDYPVTLDKAIEYQKMAAGYGAITRVVDSETGERLA